MEGLCFSAGVHDERVNRAFRRIFGGNEGLIGVAVGAFWFCMNV